ncbi:MAG: PrsW family glutamic-type intramembrane protease, partial [Thermoplasmata archaeon]|nr:PrsW family glutamic-type intramembrane protease [Thermoplasmata archaeon]
QGFTAEQTGFVILPGALASAFTMASMGRFTGRFDARLSILAGVAIFALSMWKHAHFTTDSGMSDFFWPLIFRGVGLGLIFVRSLSSVLLHGSTTAMFGYGYAQQRLRGTGYTAAGYYFLAVLMHASFNALASLSAILLAVHVNVLTSAQADVIGLVLAVTYAFAAIEHARSVIARTNFPGAQGVSSRYRPPPVRTRTDVSRKP